MQDDSVLEYLRGRSVDLPRIDPILDFSFSPSGFLKRPVASMSNRSEPEMAGSMKTGFVPVTNGTEATTVASTSNRSELKAADSMQKPLTMVLPADPETHPDVKRIQRYLDNKRFPFDPLSFESAEAKKFRSSPARPLGERKGLPALYWEMDGGLVYLARPSENELEKFLVSAMQELPTDRVLCYDPLPAEPTGA